MPYYNVQCFSQFEFYSLTCAKSDIKEIPNFIKQDTGELIVEFFFAYNTNSIFFCLVALKDFAPSLKRKGYAIEMFNNNNNNNNNNDNDNDNNNNNSNNNNNNSNNNNNNNDSDNNNNNNNNA